MQRLDNVFEFDVGLGQDVNDVGGGSAIIDGGGDIEAQQGTGCFWVWLWSDRISRGAQCSELTGRDSRNGVEGY